MSPSPLRSRDRSDSSLLSLGLLEYLKDDPRPAFIVQTTSNSGKLGLADCAFVNPALRSAELLAAKLGGKQRALRFEQFWTWVSTRLDPATLGNPVFSFAGKDWTRTTVQDKWAVVSACSTVTSQSPEAWRKGNYASDATSSRMLGAADKLRSVDVDKTSHTGSNSQDLTPVKGDLQWDFARQIDWAATGLGPMANWSPVLYASVFFLMADPRPSALIWGPERIVIYNERYVDVVGSKHPDGFGTPFLDIWSELPQFIPLLDSVSDSGKAVRLDDNQFFLNRSVPLEESWWSISLVPIYDGNKVVGISNPVEEMSRPIFLERRISTLLHLSQGTAGVKGVKSFWSPVLASLKQNEVDLPFALIHTVTLQDDFSDASSGGSGEGSRNWSSAIKHCVLEGFYGVPEDHPSLVRITDFNAVDGLIPYYRQAARTGLPMISYTTDTSSFGLTFADVICRPYSDPCTAAVICPIKPSLVSENVRAFAVFGLNTRRPYDENYAHFMLLLTRFLSTTLASTMILEDEMERNKDLEEQAAIDQSKFEEELQISADRAKQLEMKFTHFADNAPIGINIVDKEGRILYANDVWYDVTQYDRGSRESMAWLKSLHKDQTQTAEEVWHKLLVNKEFVTFESRVQKTPGSPAELDVENIQDFTWLLCSAYPQLHSDGTVEAIVGYYMNISQQKWAEDIQRKRVEEAMAAKRLQESFIDMTSHELRNPLSAVVHCADGIIAGLTGDPSAPLNQTYLTNEDVLHSIEAARTIIHCATHQKRIVDDILTFSKLDSGLLPVSPESVQIVSVVESTIQMFEAEVKAAGISLSCVVEPSIDAERIDWVLVDPSRLTQIFINLLSNAIKFTQTERERNIQLRIGASRFRPTASDLDVKFVNLRIPTLQKSRTFPGSPPGPVALDQDPHSPSTIESWDDHDIIYLRFAIVDTGRGLTAVEMDSLFQRFSQATPKTHVKYGGSGLGLFISRELTMLQGGEIGVSSERGKGSTFAFYIKSRRGDPVKAKSQMDGLSSSTKRKGDRASPAPSHRSLGQSEGPIMPMKPSPTATPSVPEDNDTKLPNVSNLSILIVEDNLINRQVLSRQLQRQGFKIYEANHGEEALAFLAKTALWKGNSDDDSAVLDLTLILMDIEMPVMDGLTCIRRIRQLQADGTIERHVPTIAVTANAREEQVNEALKSGMDAVVSKPFRVTQLISQMSSLIEPFQDLTSHSCQES